MDLPRRQEPEMYENSMDAVLSRWFTSYDEAYQSLVREGGYLFPYRNHFYITSREGVRELGLDPDDADWPLIGWNWARPDDLAAWERLTTRRLVVIYARRPHGRPTSGAAGL